MPGLRGTLWVMTKEVQGDYQKMFRLMEDSDAKVWVCLRHLLQMYAWRGKFAQRLLPSLRAFLFLRRETHEQNGASIAGEIPQGSDCEYIWADGIYSGSYGSESGPGTGCK